MSNQDRQLPALPPLIDLPVLQTTYCSQETVDKALQYLWKQAPKAVQTLTNYEPHGFGPEYLEALATILEFLESHASKEIEVPQSVLGKQDLLFEVSRRIRKALNLPERKLLGQPLAPTFKGPFPELPSIPIKTMKDGKGFGGLTQAVADRIITEVYKKRPDLFYLRVESMRKGGFGPTNHKEFGEAVQKEIRPEDNIGAHVASTIGGEISRRLEALCGINKE